MTSFSLQDYVVPPSGDFGNHAKTYKRIVALPLASAMGAEIKQIDLSNIDDEQFGELADALYHHKMVYLRDQRLTFEDQETLTQRFGEFGTDAYTVGIEGHPNLQRVLKEAETKTSSVFGGTWHTDSPFLERPPSVSLLYGVDVPPYGGDTLWANTQLAYEYLSDTMKALIQPLKVHMSAVNVVRSLQKSAKKMGSMQLSTENKKLTEGSFHPLVRTHPNTGKKSLYVDSSYSVGIKGMAEAEATALIELLSDHITQPVFTCRLRWENNTFVMWDNRSCLHHAFNDYDGFRREMYRTIVEGEIPQ